MQHWAALIFQACEQIHLIWMYYIQEGKFSRWQFKQQVEMESAPCSLRSWEMGRTQESSLGPGSRGNPAGVDRASDWLLDPTLLHLHADYPIS